MPARPFSVTFKLGKRVIKILARRHANWATGNQGAQIVFRLISYKKSQHWPPGFYIPVVKCLEATVVLQVLQLHQEAAQLLMVQFAFFLASNAQLKLRTCQTKIVPADTYWIYVFCATRQVLGNETLFFWPNLDCAHRGSRWQLK